MKEVTWPVKGRLTSKALEAIERRWQDEYPSASRLKVKDTDERGLELRASRTGARSWALSMRTGGRQRRFTIEGSTKLSLADARTAARTLRHMIANQKRDPLAERREARQRAKAEATQEAPPTLRSILDDFETYVARPKGQRSWHVRRAHLESEYRKYLDRPIAEISPELVRRVLDAAVARGAPVSGWHGFRYLRRVMTWAARRGLCTDPTSTIAREEVADTVGREGQRDRVLSPTEIAAVWPHLTDTYGAIYKLILLTGQRPGEVSGMRWQDLSLERAEWTQITNKSDRRHVVPLSSAALDILRGIERHGERVFSTRTGGQLDAKSGNWDRASKAFMLASGTSGWTRHDLRRTAATLMAECKVDRMVVELVLNHSERQAKGGGVAAIYNRFSYTTEKREAMEKLAERLLVIVNGDVFEQPAGATDG